MLGFKDYGAGAVFSDRRIVEQIVEMEVCRMNRKKAENGIPKYQQIATDIAYKIVEGTAFLRKLQEELCVFLRTGMWSILRKTVVF